MQVVADKFNIPRYVLFSSPASALPTMLHVPELIRQGRLPIDRSKWLELVHDIPGVPPTRIVDLPSPLQIHTRFLYSLFVQNAYDMHDAAGVLINTYYELEAPCIDTVRQTVYGDISGKVSLKLPDYLIRCPRFDSLQLYNWTNSTSSMCRTAFSSSCTVIVLNRYSHILLPVCLLRNHICSAYFLLDHCYRIIMSMARSMRHLPTWKNRNRACNGSTRSPNLRLCTHPSAAWPRYLFLKFTIWLLA